MPIFFFRIVFSPANVPFLSGRSLSLIFIFIFSVRSSVAVAAHLPNGLAAGSVALPTPYRRTARSDFDKSSKKFFLPAFYHLFCVEICTSGELFNVNVLKPERQRFNKTVPMPRDCDTL
jgi:hypothetical protein